jgi:hypothetical protein
MSDPREGRTRNAAQKRTLADFALHMAISCVGFTFFIIQALYGAVVSALAERLIHSTFVIHVVTALEYTLVVVDAVYIIGVLAFEVWKNCARFLR